MKLKIGRLSIFHTVLACFVVFVQSIHAFTAVVSRVTDGDTLVVQPTSGDIQKIRLYGIDCPERKQPFGDAATDIVKELAAGKVVDVEEIDQDRYKRVVGIVTLPDGTMLQDILLDSGLAWVYPQYCKRKAVCDRWKNVQHSASASGTGLWQSQNPVAPWDWRKGKH